MPRPITMFTGQWGDLNLETIASRMSDFGYEGLELACGANDHFDIHKVLEDDNYWTEKKAMLDKYGLKIWAVSQHCVGQCVLDKIDARHKNIVPNYIWGDGDPEGVRERAIKEMKDAARAAAKCGIKIITGFTGSSIWPLLYSWPPADWKDIDAGFELLNELWTPIMDVFQECGVKFALEVHPTEIAFDLYSAETALKAMNYHPAFGFNFDPSHLIWQGVDPAEFIRAFPDRIYHVHVKDAAVTLNGKSGILASHINFGDRRRGWDFRSPGHGDVNFEEIVRELNVAKYEGPLSVEWEDSGMERFWGAEDAINFVKGWNFSPSDFAFDSNFSKD
ncbi:MAG: sugar phosphate isomerase/epimerase [Planctomycetaceae bacterium]|nr:sugar phosphate isomerase/epimerase [Planctomycetaceae bacterium]